MRLSRIAAAAIALIVMLTGAYVWNSRNCCAPPPHKPAEPLGLMTSLPLFWPLGADIAALASGDVEPPWQREVLEARFDLALLDTLSPVASLAPNEPDTDPLAGLDRLAIIQPRVLTPSNNAALDEWVRAGGEALLVLDPALTGEYDLPLGDPRRPAGSALFSIPPVVERWGLEMEYTDHAASEDGLVEVMIGDVAAGIDAGSQWNVIDNTAAQCELLASRYIARCRVGEGQVTLMGDAALFEHREFAGDRFEVISALFDTAFSNGE